MPHASRQPARWTTPTRLALWALSALVAAAVLLPTVYLFVRAAGADPQVWAGLLRTRTLEILGRTLLLAASVTAASIGVAVPLAWLTTRTDLPLRRAWSLILPLPLVVPSYVSAYLFVSAFGPRGLLQGLLEAPLGVTRLPEIYGLPGAVVILTLLSYPYVFLSTRAALLRMSPTLEESARSLGEGAWSTFWRVTLPLLRPALGAGGLLVALYTLRDFGAVSLLRYDTFTRVLYVSYRSFDREGSALLALVLVVLTLVVLGFEAWLLRRVTQPTASATRPPRILPLGSWRWPAFLFTLGVAFLSLFLPAGLLLYWLIRGLNSGETLMALGGATWNSLLGSGLAAALAVAAALPVAILSVRYPGRLTRLIERLTYASFALPGIVIALALVFFGARQAPFLYQTLALLVFAYAVLYLPQAVGALRTTLLQIPPSLDEAARSLGRRPLQAFWEVTVPLLRPGLLAGASLVFLTAMKDLPATLILAPLGFDTLATEVWSAVSEAFFARAAAPALLIVLMSSLPLAFFVGRD